MESHDLVTQRILKGKGLTALIALLSMIAQMSTDMYLPALPTMTEHYGTTQALTSQTVTVFFVAMAIGMLLIGPMSDKYGRKPVLVASNAVSLVCCLACLAVPTVEGLIALRAIQGLAAGGMTAISTALVRDCFTGTRMRTVLSVTQAITLIAPMVAPLVGVTVLSAFEWQGVFVTLAVFLAIILVMSLMLTESLPPEKRLSGGVLKAYSGLARYAKDRLFVSLVLIGGIVSMPYMAYIGVSSYVFIDRFAVSEVVYGICFAISSVASILGPLAYLKFGSASSTRSFSICLIVQVICTIALLLVGGLTPVTFLICMMPYMFTATYLRPMITNILLDRVTENAGAAASMLNFVLTAIGCVGMLVGSAGWSDTVMGVNVVMAVSIVLSIVIWVAVACRTLKKTLADSMPR